MRDLRVSIVVPVYNMANAIAFVTRNIDSILIQTYKNYEIIVSDDSEDDQIKDWVSQYPVKYFKNPGSKGMANNTNHGLDQATGDVVKILFQDDYFLNENSLFQIVKHFTARTYWLVTGCTHSAGDGGTFNDHYPFFSFSENTIGSPSVLAFRREVLQRFDPQFHWVLDLDLYKQLFMHYGRPHIYNEINVVIGLHGGQKTNLLSEHEKQLEHQLLRQKYDSSIKTRL